MTDDIVARLRDAAQLEDKCICMAELHVSAAAEIERLRAELAAERERAEQWKLISKSEAEDSDAFEAERDALRECLGFFASVIKSGEGWTETCQRKYDAALKGDGDD